MTNKKLKAGLITAAGCSAFLLMVYRHNEKLHGSKAKQLVYDRLITDGSIDKDKLVDWLVRSPLVNNAKEAERAIREVIENITPKPKQPK